MNSVERAVEAVKAGIPIAIVRKAHPEIVIRDEEHGYKFVPKGVHVDLGEKTLYINKDELRRKREAELNLI